MLKKIPLYQQIEEYIRNQIEEEIYPVGSKIPYEHEICDMFQASRMTVNKALVNLVNQGMIYRNAGRGSFVRMRYPESKARKLFTFTENMSKIGKKVTNKILEYRLIVASEDLEAKEKLQLQDDEYIHKIVRQRFASDELVAIEIMYFTGTLVNVIDIRMITSSIHDYIEKNLNLDITHSDVVFKAMFSNDKTNELFGRKVEEPLLQAKTLSYVNNNVPLEYSIIYYIGDKYEYLMINYRDK